MEIDESFLAHYCEKLVNVLLLRVFLFKLGHKI